MSYDAKGLDGGIPLEMRRSFESTVARQEEPKAQARLTKHQDRAIAELTKSSFAQKPVIHKTPHLSAYIERQSRITSVKRIPKDSSSCLERSPYAVFSRVLYFLDIRSFIATRELSHIINAWSGPYSTSIWLEKIERNEQWKEIFLKRSYQTPAEQARLMFECCRLATLVQSNENVSGVVYDLLQILPNNEFSTHLVANALLVDAQHKKLAIHFLAHVQFSALQLAHQKASGLKDKSILAEIDKLFQIRVRGAVVLLAATEGTVLDVSIIKFCLRSGPITKEDRRKAVAIAKGDSSITQNSDPGEELLRVEDDLLNNANRKELVKALSDGQPGCIIA